MKVFMRICLEDTGFPNGDETFWLKRGQEYTTSDELEGEVIVFTRYWFKAPAKIFGGALPLGHPDLHSS